MKYTLSFTIETDDDASSILGLLQDAAVDLDAAVNGTTTADDVIDSCCVEEEE